MESNWVYMNLASDEYDVFGYVWKDAPYRLRVVILDGPSHMLGRGWTVARSGDAYRYYHVTPEEETMLMIKYGGIIRDKIEVHDSIGR